MARLASGCLLIALDLLLNGSVNDLDRESPVKCASKCPSKFVPEKPSKEPLRPVLQVPLFTLDCCAEWSGRPCHSRMALRPWKTCGALGIRRGADLADFRRRGHRRIWGQGWVLILPNSKASAILSSLHLGQRQLGQHLSSLEPAKRRFCPEKPPRAGILAEQLLSNFNAEQLKSLPPYVAEVVQLGQAKVMVQAAKIWVMAPGDRGTTHLLVVRYMVDQVPRF